MNEVHKILKDVDNNVELFLKSCNKRKVNMIKPAEDLFKRAF